MSSHLGLEYVDWESFDLAIEKAKQDKIIAEVMCSADHFLHTIFVGGDEPQWSNDAQRTALLHLRDVLIPLGASIGVLDEEEIRKMDAFKVTTSEGRKS